MGERMDVYTALTYVVLGIVSGAIGQGVRAVIGIKKAIEESGKNWEEWLKDGFNSKLLLLSLFIGGIAGGLASFALLGNEVNPEFLLGIMAAGYAGTDFIEGFMITRIKK